MVNNTPGQREIVPAGEMVDAGSGLSETMVAADVAEQEPDMTVTVNEFAILVLYSEDVAPEIFFPFFFH
jgi:hypothetical protein